MRRAEVCILIDNREDVIGEAYIPVTLREAQLLDGLHIPFLEGDPTINDISGIYPEIADKLQRGMERYLKAYYRKEPYKVSDHVGWFEFVHIRQTELDYII